MKVWNLYMAQLWDGGFPPPPSVSVFQTNRNDFLCHVFDALNGKGTGSISMIQKNPQTHVKKGLRFRVRETVQCVNMYDMRWSDLFAATMRICSTLASTTERPKLWTTFLLPRVMACGWLWWFMLPWPMCKGAHLLWKKCEKKDSRIWRDLWPCRLSARGQKGGLLISSFNVGNEASALFGLQVLQDGSEKSWAILKFNGQKGLL